MVKLFLEYDLLKKIRVTFDRKEDAMLFFSTISEDIHLELAQHVYKQADQDAFKTSFDYAIKMHRPKVIEWFVQLGIHPPLLEDYDKSRLMNTIRKLSDHPRFLPKFKLWIKNTWISYLFFLIIRSKRRQYLISEKGGLFFQIVQSLPVELVMRISNLAYDRNKNFIEPNLVFDHK